ncbi:MAG TPA: hypothetical protein VFX45_10680 [Solirubrobacterales bacterium]|nr:hypothetical protein [Solirubrobacterales bacterium]
MTLCSPHRTSADRCPGVLAVHEAEDGGLARIRLAGGRASAPQLAAVAAAAGQTGSGLVEITGRANLQLRGLAPGAEAQLAEMLEAAGLLPSRAHDRARNLLASPLAGRHPDSVIETDAIVAGLDAAICAEPRLAGLPGRFLFAVDDGSGLGRLGGADLALAPRPEAPGALRLWIGGAETDAAPGAAEAPALASRAALGFLDLCAADGVVAWHVRELEDGAERVAAALGLELIAPADEDSSTPVAGIRPGFQPQRDGREAVTALAPLGRFDATTLDRVAELLGPLGAEARFSRWRTVTVPDLEPAAAKELGAALERADLIVEPATVWEGLSACAGLGYCSKARFDVRAAAQRRASTRRGGAPAEHWSACGRRCGEPSSAPVAVAAEEGGAIAVRAGGRSRLVADEREALALLAEEAQ